MGMCCIQRKGSVYQSKISRGGVLIRNFKLDFSPYMHAVNTYLLANKILTFFTYIF